MNKIIIIQINKILFRIKIIYKTIYINRQNKKILISLIKIPKIIIKIIYEK
jgi:hypothetical protein